MRGWLPVQEPEAAVSICPSRAVPRIAGAVEPAGGIAATTPLGAESALVEAPVFEAVTCTTSVLPTSAEVRS